MRICGNLEIKEALHTLIQFLKAFMPVTKIYLQIITDRLALPSGFNGPVFLLLMSWGLSVRPDGSSNGSDYFRAGQYGRPHFVNLQHVKHIKKDGMGSQSFENYEMEYMDVLSPYGCDGI